MPKSATATAPGLGRVIAVLARGAQLVAGVKALAAKALAAKALAAPEPKVGQLV